MVKRKEKVRYLRRGRVNGRGGKMAPRADERMYRLGTGGGEKYLGDAGEALMLEVERKSPTVRK